MCRLSIVQYGANIISWFMPHPTMVKCAYHEPKREIVLIITYKHYTPLQQWLIQQATAMNPQAMGLDLLAARVHFTRDLDI